MELLCKYVHFKTAYLYNNLILEYVMPKGIVYCFIHANLLTNLSGNLVLCWTIMRDILMYVINDIDIPISTHLGADTHDVVH